MKRERIGVWVEIVVDEHGTEHTITSSPLMSFALFRLSSFLPSPRVAEWMSVAK